MATAPVSHAGPTADDEAQILDAIDAWVEKEVRPIARKFDQADEYPHDLVEQMKELGLFGATISQEYGGLGHDPVAMVAATEELARASAGLASYYIMCAGYGGLNISEAGSPEQKRRLLPELASGRLAFSYGLSEPNVGADLTSVETRAERHGDRIVVNGAKRWTSAACMTDYVYALVRSGPVEQRRRNLSFVLVPTKAAGVTVTNLSAMGHNGIPLADVTFENVELSIDDVVGGARPAPFHGRDHHRRGALRAFRGVRARPSRHPRARHRHSGQAGRPMRRALPGEADTRHPGHSRHHGRRSYRSPYGADRPFRPGVSSQ